MIFFDRSPFATAVVTSAMLRTWPVRLAAMEFTLSVRSFHTPATPGTCAWPPSLPSVPTSFATRDTSEAKRVQLPHHGVHHRAQAQRLAAQRPAFDLEHHGLRKVALRHRADDARHLVHRIHHVADQGVDRTRSRRPRRRSRPAGSCAGRTGLPCRPAPRRARSRRPSPPRARPRR